MKKVLIITYYWPPSGGAGVQRWLKFAKYLREFGWEPVIYTPENPEAPAIDHSLEKDIPDGITVIKTFIREPYTFYKRFVGRKKDDSIKAGFLSEKKNPGLTEKISVWIRGNFFIPDARMLWIKPSVRFLTKYLSENPVDAIVSTGPPHSMHLIAMGVKKALGIPWLADFRDPWTNIDFYDKLMLTKRSDKKHRHLEKEVIHKADKIITVNHQMADEYKLPGASETEVVTNGFDPEDFTNMHIKPTGKFEIVHIGSLNKDRNPLIFWKAISELTIENAGFARDMSIILIGLTDYSVFEEIHSNSLGSFVKSIPYKPHDELMKVVSGASVLFLPLNNTPNAKGITSGKLFEYLALRRPIYCIGPEDGDAARIIEECEVGVTIDFTNKEKMKTTLMHYYNRYLQGKQMLEKTSAKKIQKYSRINLTHEIASHLESIIG